MRGGHHCRGVAIAVHDRAAADGVLKWALTDVRRPKCHPVANDGWRRLEKAPAPKCGARQPFPKEAQKTAPQEKAPQEEAQERAWFALALALAFALALALALGIATAEAPA
eukprot:COSAG01_NODE_881_length_12936_cov_11.801200_6_plen_111_part_00